MTTPNNEQASKLIWWLIVTLILLGCMALFSALDGVFVALFFVASLFSGWKAYAIWATSRSKPRSDLHDSSTPGRPGANKSALRPKIHKPIKSQKQSGFDWEKVFTFLKKIPAKVLVFVAIWVVFISGIIYGVSYLFSDVLDGDSIQSEMYRMAGDQLYNEENYDSAYIYYRRSISFKDDNTDALFGYGNCLYTRNLSDSSLYYYDRVLQLDPDHDDARFNIAWVSTQRGDFNRSIEELERLLDRNQNYYRAYQLMGDNHYLRGNYSEAIRNYKEVLLYDEYNIEVNKVLGELVHGDEGAIYRERGRGAQ